MIPIVTQFCKVPGVLIAVATLVWSQSANAAVSSAEALADLQKGNARFASGQALHPNLTAARRNDVAGEQAPFATILACSDSRVPVEAIFDQGVGDLFVIRVIGNVSRSDQIGSIEYGTEHLDTPLLVVLGHSACGAVKAAVNGGELHGHIPHLVGNIAPAIATLTAERPELSADELMDQAVKANVWRSIDDLLAGSPLVRKQVRDQQLQVVGAVYDVASGSVTWLGNHPEQARLLAYTSDTSQGQTPQPATSLGAASAGGFRPLSASLGQSVLLIATMITMAIIMIFRGYRVRRRRLPSRTRVAVSVGAGEH